MKIIKANKSHKDFILESNRKVNEVSGLNSSRLDEFIDKDLFSKNPKFHCLIADEHGQSVGMCLYSDMYMANHGIGFYLANVYVLPEFRKKYF